jgi:hypothetical protein
MNIPIASESLFGQKHPHEDRFEITVQIGTPYQVGTIPEEWACPVSVKPLYKVLHDAHGEGSLQALCLAISLAQDLLQAFRENGGKLTFETGDEFPLEAYSFGVTAGRCREARRGYTKMPSKNDSIDADDPAV